MVLGYLCGSQRVSQVLGFGRKVIRFRRWGFAEYMCCGSVCRGCVAGGVMGGW